MSEFGFGANEVLLVASRGVDPQHGLWLWQLRDGAWTGRQVDTVRQLSSLTGHPHLPVVYGSSGGDENGTLHAWRIDGQGETTLSVIASGGADPCHVAVDPSGRYLVATNYGSSDLSVQRLDETGAFVGSPSLVALSGSGPDEERQEAAHPHQAVFVGDRLLVIDLGADLVREYAIGDIGISELAAHPVPPGTGPRHAVALPDGRIAISGELGETVIVGNLGQGASGWTSARSTGLTGPAKTRHTRNYPGDIQRSVDGRIVYIANRSHDTVASFDVSGAEPKLVGEVDTGAHWPQHLLVRDQHLLVAGWDSSKVVALPLADGIPQAGEAVFECEGAGWLHAHSLG